MRAILAVFSKDVRTELRARAAVTAMLVFAVLTVIVFNFAFEASREETLYIAPGVLWIAFTFSSILGLNRSFALEREAGALTSLLLAPVDRGSIYLGKMAANALFIVVLQALVLPLFALFYNFDLRPALPRLALIGVLGAWALSSAGTVFAGVAGSTRMRDVMTPLLLLPAATPVVIAAVEATGMAMRGESEGFATALRLLTAFAIVFTTVSYLIFDFVLEE